MRASRLVVPFIASALLAFFSGIASADPDPANGATLYAASCASCHTAFPSKQTKNAGGGKPEVIQNEINGGSLAMAGRPELQALTFSQLADIATYLLQLRGPPAINYQGLWWAANGTESFWGINFSHQGDQVFATWYTYDTSGNAWWLTMLADRTTATSSTYTGKIFQTTGSAFNAQPFVPVDFAKNNLQVGTGTVSFTGYNTGNFSYTVNGVTQAKDIARFVLIPGGIVPQCAYSATSDLNASLNYQDLWWVPAESGWGVNFAHQADLLFATWYTYDAKGMGTSNPPLWLSALLQRKGTTNVFEGPLTRTSGARFDNYKASDVVVSPAVGTATVTFTDGNHATFAYTTNGTSGLPAVTQAKSITRILYAPGGTTCN